jgi:hypothetical protein
MPGILETHVPTTAVNAPATGYDVGARFDGSTAYYSGPTEVADGCALTFTFTTAVPDAVLAVSRLDPAPSFDALVADLATHPFYRLPHYVKATMTQVGPGAFTMTLHAGTYAVLAGTSVLGTDTMHLASLIEVAA